MELVVVERRLNEAHAYEEIATRERCAAGCFNLYQVRFVRSYFSRDGLRMICIFEAPDAEAVRQANRKAGLPFDSVWTADEHVPPPRGAPGAAG